MAPCLSARLQIGGPDDIWAVGYAGDIVHWNGSAWSTTASGTTSNLSDVWGSGPDEVWAVGVGGAVLHYRR